MVKPYYFKLGKKFTVQGDRFLGPVAASPDAVFMTVRITPVNLMGSAVVFTGMSLGPFGAFAAGVANAFLANLRGHHHVMETDLRKFPKDILEDPDWPIKLKSGRTFVIPKAAVRSVKYSIWGKLIIHTIDARFTVDISMFRVRCVIKSLREAGWEV